MNRDRIQLLVLGFAEEVAAQTEALALGDHVTGNKHAKQYIEIFRKLREIGDPGREALSGLMEHPRLDVRVAAAGFLLRYRTDAALQVLRMASGGTGMIPFVASQAIARWEDGTWNLDPRE